MSGHVVERGRDLRRAGPDVRHESVAFVERGGRGLGVVGDERRERAASLDTEGIEPVRDDPQVRRDGIEPWP